MCFTFNIGCNCWNRCFLKLRYPLRFGAFPEHHHKFWFTSIRSVFSKVNEESQGKVILVFPQPAWGGLCQHLRPVYIEYLWISGVHCWSYSMSLPTRSSNTKEESVQIFLTKQPKKTFKRFHRHLHVVHLQQYPDLAPKGNHSSRKGWPQGNPPGACLAFPGFPVHQEAGSCFQKMPV